MSLDGWASLLAILSALGSLWVAIRAQLAVRALSRLVSAQAQALNALYRAHRDDKTPTEFEVAFIKLQSGGVIRRKTGVLSRFGLPEE